MSEENKGVSDTLDQNVGDVSQETQKTVVSDDNQTVQYHTHKKLLGQHKKAMAEMESMRERLATMEQEKLEAEGDVKKELEFWKKRAEDHGSKLKQTVGTIAHKSALSAIVDEAVKMGCGSVKLLKKYVQDDIGSLQFSEDFEPDADQVKELLKRVQDEAPELFAKQAPSIANHSLSKGSTSDKSKNLKSMSMDQLVESWGKSI